MRLIDADKVKQYILEEGFYCDTEADKEATAEKIDELFPTVEAIQIEWIKDQLIKEEYRTFMVDYIEWGNCLRWLIDEWKNKNESNI